jgi:hypothetical protein
MKTRDHVIGLLMFIMFWLIAITCESAEATFTDFKVKYQCTRETGLYRRSQQVGARDSSTRPCDLKPAKPGLVRITHWHWADSSLRAGFAGYVIAD